jgi:hypothetical protein
MCEDCGTSGGQEKCIQDFWWGDPREGDSFEGLGIDGKITLKWIFRKWDGKAWTGLLWLRVGTVGGRLGMR